MAEVAPTPPATQESYRPVSGLAIAGLVLAVASALVFLLDSPWLLPLLAGPGLLLCFLARRRIRRADGTLAGYHLAGLGAAIALVVVLVYVTRHFTIYWIIRSESREFQDRWLQRMLEGKEGHAFLDTVPPEQRQITFNPTDLRKLRAHFPSPGNPDESLFDAFRRAHMTGALLRYRDRFQWEYRGFEEMTYALGSYGVKHRYRIATPEISGDVIFTLRSGEAKLASGPRREWRVEIAAAEFAPQPAPTPTDYGLDLHDAQREGSKVMKLWLRSVADGERDKAEAALGTASDATLKSSHAQLYNVLRQNSGPRERLRLNPKETYLVFDDREGKAWTLEYHGVMDTGAREVEFRMRLQTDDLLKGPDSWRIAGCRFLGERKKMPMDASGGAGAMPVGSGLPQPR